MAGNFTGFSKKTIEFYKQLEKHNDQQWFEEHRDDYLEHAMQPAQALVEELGPRLRKLSGGIGFSSDYNGRGSIKKIHTDRRFNPDRDPYKTWLDIIFWEGPFSSIKDNSVLGLRITPVELHFFAGLKHFNKQALKAYRQAVIDSKLGPQLKKATEKVVKAGYELGGTKGYKQTPRGYASEHPNAPFLLHDGLYAVWSGSHPKELFSADFVDFAHGKLKDMYPVHKWCVAALETLG